MYLIIPIDKQYIIILVNVRFCVRHSYLFFILFVGSVVLLLSLNLLFSVQLNSKGYR